MTGRTEIPAASSNCPCSCDAGIAGDDGAFVEWHRRELFRHCVRILHSSEQAEDAVQEALLRARRSRSHVAGLATFRAWLYRIATNACLDELRDRSRPRVHSTWSGPFDESGGGVPSVAEATVTVGRAPDAVAEAREALEGAFLTAIRPLPRP